MPASDERLLEIERLYAGQFPRFVRVARAILGERERAVEAVQDGFADAIRTRGTYRGEGAFEGWVWRVVVNAARKAARRPPAQAATSDESASYELPPARP